VLHFLDCGLDRIERKINGIFLGVCHDASHYSIVYGCEWKEFDVKKRDYATVESVSRKKNKPELETIPPVDEAEFTNVIRKMVNTSPVTREDVEKRHKRRRNPETDPRYLPVFPSLKK